MKIGVLSDTHLYRVTKDFRRIYDNYLSDCDLVIHAGDTVSTGVIDFLERGVFYGVYGNMDPSDVRARLPEKKIIKIGEYRLGIIHGWGPATGLEERIRTEFEAVDVIIYGHSHVAANHMRDGILFFNPGTATGTTKDGMHSLGILTVDEEINGEIICL